MKSSYLIIGCILLLAGAVMPAQAFSVQSLAINIDANGNAQAHFTYGLSFTEQIAVFANITNPASELLSAFKTASTGMPPSSTQTVPQPMSSFQPLPQ